MSKPKPNTGAQRIFADAINKSNKHNRKCKPIETELNCASADDIYNLFVKHAKGEVDEQSKTVLTNLATLMSQHLEGKITIKSVEIE